MLFLLLHDEVEFIVVVSINTWLHRRIVIVIVTILFLVQSLQIFNVYFVFILIMNFDGLQLDVVVADLDGGSLRIPDNIQIPLMPQPMLDRMRNSLQQVSLQSSIHN